MSDKEVNRVEKQIVQLATSRPVFYSDILHELKGEDYRTIMLAFGQIRTKKLFDRDKQGRYVIKSSS
jgi:hypothetical protein